MDTKIIKLSACETELQAKLADAAAIIKRGGLVVFPTETVYGLGGDATNPEAARNIYQAKGRPSDNPLIIHIAEPKQAEEYAYTNETYYKLANEFMPGPLTVILGAKSTVPKETRGGLATVAVRCPENPIARALISLAGVPIAAPSANLSGKPSPTKAFHVIEDMNGRVDMIIDGGEADFGLESTIVKIEDDGGVTLLRPGKITADDIKPFVAYVKIANAVKEELKDGEAVLSPGMKYRHYAPSAPLFLLDCTIDAALGYISKRGAGRRIAVISYKEDADAYSSVCDRVYSIGDKDDELTQAHRLFDLLRGIDNQNFDEIYAPLPKTDGVGLALYNRLIRASAHHIIRM